MLLLEHIGRYFHALGGKSVGDCDHHHRVDVHHNSRRERGLVDSDLYDWVSEIDFGLHDVYHRLVIVSQSHAMLIHGALQDLPGDLRLSRYVSLSRP